MVNKNAYLTNGKSLVGYHILRQQHLAKNFKPVFLDYITVLDLYKNSENDLKFD